MRLAVLGPLKAGTQGASVERLSHRRLLAILVQAGEPLDLERLADRFWPDERPATWKAALQTHVSALRRLIGSDVVVRRGGGYALDLEGHEVDLHGFAASVAAVREASAAGRWDDAVTAADDALRLWRGEPFPELADDEFALADIVQLREQHVEVAERRADALLQLGRHEEALPELEALVIEHPLRERLCALLMTARARSGRAAEALAAYRELRARMAELGLEPDPALRDLEARILREDPSVVWREARHNLPSPRTSFVGREDQLGELSGLLRQHRLVTLTGVGGVGKTRLAQVLAREHLDDFADGVRLVDLAPVTDPVMVASATAVAFGLRARSDPRDALRDALRHRDALCVLDNCEHLLGGVVEIAELILDAGPGMRIVATSRVPLGLPDEVRFAVPALAVPDEDGDPGEVAAADSFRLLIDRARLATRGSRGLDPEGPRLAELCRRLDGLPLAIELAAARLGSVGPATVVEKLTHNLDLLSAEGSGRPDRHETLEATIAWSYELLTDTQRTVFARLAMFAGGFTLPAAETVCAHEGLSRDDVAAAVVALVERSMVVSLRRSDGMQRFRLLETIRTFARERLEDAIPGVDELRDRHLAWAVQLAGEVVADLDRPDQLAALEGLEAERDNLLAAHGWAEARHDRRAATVLATALAWFWAKRGQYGRAIHHLHEAIDGVDEVVDPERAADLRARLAGIHYSASREHDALREATHARDLLADAPPSAAKVRALTEHASLHMRIVQRDREVAFHSARGAIEAANAIGDRFAEAHALRTLGTALGRAGDAEAGVARLREALAIAHELDHDSQLLGTYLSLFITLLELTEDHAEAMRVADEALRWLDRGGERLAGSASLLMWIAYGSVKAGRVAQAEATLERSTHYHLEGAMRMSELTVRALISWTRGRLEDVAADAVRLRELPVASRYYRLLYPLEAEVAAEEGRDDDVRVLVRRHLAEDVLDVEQPLKAGTLWPAVRAEVGAARRSSGSVREEHLRRADALIERMRSLIERYPPSPPSGLRFEMPQVYVALAEAERTLVGGSDAARWRRALESPSYLYWRAYARLRLAEASLANGDRSEGASELRAAHREAMQLGAPRLLAPIEARAAEAGVELGSEGVSPPA